MKSEFFEAYKKLQVRIKTIAPNAKGYGYNYADLVKVWEMVRGAVAEEGFIVINQCDEKGITTRLVHNSEEEVVSTIPFVEEITKIDKESKEIKIYKPTPQDRGSEITYARRYNLLCLLGIVVSGEDNDANY